MMRRITVVFVGGGMGSVLRAGLLAWLAPGGATSSVLLVNLLGAFILGIVVVLADEAGLLQPTTRLFLAVGLLGGFTTFSTFIWGADLLALQPTRDAVLDYLVASVGGGAITVVAGLAAGRELVVLLERAAVLVLTRLDARGLRRMSRPEHAIAVTEGIQAEDQMSPRLLTDGNRQEPA
jgi:CrcB protein